MSLIPQFFLDAVIAIGIDSTSPNDVGKTETVRKWIGTGFLYGSFKEHLGDGNRLHNTFLVTNKHVIERQKIIFLKFNSSSGTTSKDYPVDLYEKDKPIWLGHPDKKVDVSIIPINANLLKEEGMQTSYFQSDEHVLTGKQMQSEGVTEGDSIFVLGFPMGLVEPDYQYVICRGGWIARVRDLYLGTKSEFMIDAPVFPGNSGGPVVLRPEIAAIKGTKSISRAALIGIVKSYVPYIDVAISPQTKRPRISFEENSGLANVEPVEHIQTTVELFLKQNPEKAA